MRHRNVTCKFGSTSAQCLVGFPLTQPHIAGRQRTARRRRCALRSHESPRVCTFIEARRSEPRARGVGGSRDHSIEPIVVRMREHRHRRCDARDECVDFRRGAATGSRGPRPGPPAAFHARRQHAARGERDVRRAAHQRSPDRLRQPDQRLRLRRGRRSTRSTKTPSCRLRPSTTTASSSRRPKRSRTGSARPTTRRAAASAIRTS